VSHRVTRRLALAAPAAFFAAASHAEISNAFALTTPEGDVIRNFAVPQNLAPSDLPGVLVEGGAKTGPILFEFFDYACPYCRMAAQELDFLLGADSGMRLGLLHHPVLGEGSAQAARAVLASAKIFGEEAALRLHARLFETPGRVGADKVLALAAAQNLDAARLEREAERAETKAVLDAHANRAKTLGLRQTPAFVLGGYAFVGWPGAATVERFVQATRQCGGLACPNPRP